jgi:hypothetical protein
MPLVKGGHRRRGGGDVILKDSWWFVVGVVNLKGHMFDRPVTGRID